MDCSPRHLGYILETYGCQMNSAESAAMEQILVSRGWRALLAGSKSADCAQPPALLILNTCSVRATAEQRIVGRLAHWNAARRNGNKDAGRPALKILIAGCAAAQSGAALREAGADYLLPPQEKDRFEEVLAEIEGAYTPASPALPADKNRAPVRGFFNRHHYKEGAASAFVPVMHGCNNFCAYCIVPYLRGREISRPAASILSELDFLIERNVREITLLGQNVNSYHDGRYDFAGLIRLVARHIEGSPLRWVRFLSSHPKDMSDDIIAALAESPCFCRHLHLPVQHGTDKILAAMNRRYTRAGYSALVEKLRGALPSLTLTTDILVGFPGETDADFAEVLSLMDELRFNAAFMYHYNPRSGTAAFALPARVPEAVKRARLAQVIELQKQHTRAALEAAIGARRLVLCGAPSRKNTSEFLCHTEHDEQCVLGVGGIKSGSFVPVRLRALRGNTFTAERAE